MKEYGKGPQISTSKPAECLERREKARFQIRAFVDFEWLDGEGISHRGQGLTRDISAKGLFIFSDSHPPTKANLRAQVFFCSAGGANTDLQLCARAVVLRVESPSEIGGHMGFAVLNRSYELASQNPMEDPKEEDLKSKPN